MANAYANYTLLVPSVILYPNLDVPKKAKRNVRGQMKEVGDARYGADFVLDDMDYTNIKAIWKKLCDEKWGEGSWSIGDLKLPRTVGDKEIEKQQAAGKPNNEKLYGAIRGRTILKARSNSDNQPSLGFFNANGEAQPYPQITSSLVKQHFFAGMKVHALVAFSAYDPINDDEDDRQGKRGIACYLSQVITTDEGEKFFSAGPTMAEAFKGIRGHVSNVNPKSENESW